MRTSRPNPGDGNDSSVALAAASSQLEISSCAVDPGLSVDGSSVNGAALDEVWPEFAQCIRLVEQVRADSGVEPEIESATTPPVFSAARA
jgi:hypothetical protein